MVVDMGVSKSKKSPLVWFYSWAQVKVFFKWRAKFQSHHTRELYKKSKTIIIVSHRLFTLKKTDILYILKKGKVIEKGIYSKLKNNKKSVFYKMLNNQKNN